MAPLSLKIILENGAVTRTVMFDSSTKVADAYATIKEKVLNADDGKEYALFLTSADDDKSGIWLEAHRPLDYYMLRNGDCLHYLRRQRNLRVKMLDGSVKTLQVDESKNIGDLMMVICGKIGITNHDEYGLCQEDPMEQDESKETRPATGTLTLKRKKQERERDAKMDQLSKKLKTDDNVDWLDQHRTLREVGVDPNETLLLKRRLFYSDRNVDSRDPVQLNLLYLQTRDAILNGRHPVTEAQAADCKIRWIHIRDVHRRIIRKCITQPKMKIKLYKYHSELAFMVPFYKEIAPQATETEMEFETNNDDEDNNDDDAYDDGKVEDPIAEATESDDLPPSVKKKKHYPKWARTRKNKMMFEKEPSKSKKNRKGKMAFETVTTEMNEDRNVTVNEVSPSIGAPSPTLFDPKDPVDMFLLNIGATLKTFSPYHLNVAKSKIFSVVQEHEMQQIMNQPSHNESLCETKVSTSDHDHLYSC